MGNLSEFQLIERFFSRGSSPRDDVVVGVGDDGAVLQVPPGRQLVVTMDTMVEGVHFASSDDPAHIGHKLLAVNLSDLAAMGAEAAWATLAVTLPRVDESWLSGFSRGLMELARKCGIQLVGGDVTRGPLTLTLQAHGLLPAGEALRRNGARLGDGIYVTGTLGDAALALAAAGNDLAALPEQDMAVLRQRLHCPQPQLAAGQMLRGYAHSAIDISDGVAADLGHILECSGNLGARVELDALPLSAAFRQIGDMLDLDPPPAYAAGVPSDAWLAVTGGDDYELCFTADPADEALLKERLASAGVCLTRIGTVQADPGIRLVAAGGEASVLGAAGFRHF